MLEGLGLQWVEIHGALTHFPIALLMIAAALEVGAAAFLLPRWRAISFWMVAGAALSGVAALISGLVTADGMEGGGGPLMPTHRLAAYGAVAVAIIVTAARARERDRTAPRAAPALMAAVVIAASLVGLTGYLGGRMVFGEATTAAPDAPSVRIEGVDPGQVARGQSLFARHRCASCHSIAGQGARRGPDLTQTGSRHPNPGWQADHLRDPARLRPGSAMPRYDRLPEEDLRALAAYLVSFR